VAGDATVLGHATVAFAMVAFTMDVYTEVAEELADAAMEALAAYISPIA
jgi:cytochrome c553